MPLKHPRWGMPGPIWTMVAWSGLTCLLLVASLALPLTSGSGFPTVTTSCALILATSAIIGLVGRARLPHWWIYLNTAVWILVTCWLMWPSAPIEIAVLMFGFVICAVYVGYWMPRVAVIAYAVAWSLASLGVLVLQGRLAQTALIWLTATVVSATLALLLSSLTGYLRHQATHDPLTGVLNRAGLLAAAAGIPADTRTLQPTCVSVIDLDGFKTLNDRDGHVVGDAVLRDVATCLTRGLRAQDLVARFGGDEFVVILPRTSADDAERVVERACRDFPIGRSYGVAPWDPDSTIDHALARADRRMYDMKARQRGA